MESCFVVVGGFVLFRSFDISLLLLLLTFVCPFFGAGSLREMRHFRHSKCVIRFLFPMFVYLKLSNDEALLGGQS